MKKKSFKIQAWWKYNPLTMKPTSLEPVLPWHGYYYYGPDPAAGVSYGLYEDEDKGEKFVSVSDQVVYSPMSGEPATLVMDIPEDQVAGLFEKATSDFHDHSCGICKAGIKTNCKLDIEKLHCFKCGAVITTSIRAVTNKGNKTMDKAKLEAVKARVRARIQAKKEAEAAAKAAEVKVEAAPAVEVKPSLTDRIRARIRAAKEAKAASEATAEEYITLDEILDEVKESGKDEAKAEEAKEAPKAEEKPAEEAKAEEKPAEEKAEEAKEAPKAEEKPAEEAKAEGDDEYVDLDMVLSNIEQKAERKRRMRRILARKRAMARLQSRRAEADAEKPEAPVEVDLVKPAAPAAPMEVAPAAPMAEKVEEKKEEKMEEKEEDAEACDYSTSMKYEPLASIESLASVAAKSEIDMALYGEQDSDPTWSVMVKGTPACRIRLQAQSEPETIRKLFCSEDYALDLIEHCAAAGFVPTMNRVNAEFWANLTSDAALVEKVKAEAKAEGLSEKEEYTSSFCAKFQKCLTIAVAGANKNFYPEMGNPLKDHLFANMKSIGVPEQTAYMTIEKAFSEGGAEYFNAVIAKALEFYTMPEEARSTIAKAISQSESLDVFNGKSLEDAAPATLSERLTQASAVASVAQMGVRQAPLSIDTNEYKAQLKGVFKR